MALFAAILLWMTILAPVMAVEALLLTLLLCVCGASNYWPANLFVFAIGCGGFAGYVQGVLIWWETRVREAKSRRASGIASGSAGGSARRRDARRKAREAEYQEVETPEDGSAGLVALLVGTLTASIIGALP